MNDTEERILIETIRLIDEKSIESISTVTVANKVGLSEGSIFKYFKTKKNLMSQSFLYIDSFIVKEISKAHIDFTSNDSLKMSLRKVWEKFFEWLVDNPMFARFYWQFRNSKFYDKELLMEESKVYQNMQNQYNKANEVIKAYDEYTYSITWIFILDSTLNLAVKLGDNQKYLKQNEELIEKLVLGTLLD